jgi:hypothetical protein
MKKIVLLTITLNLLSGCELFTPDDKYFYLPDNWKTTLKKGDTLVYVSNTGKLAKYIVHDVTLGNIWHSLSSKDGIDNPPFAYSQSQITYIDTVGKKETENHYHCPDNFSVPVVGQAQLYNNAYFISIGIHARLSKERFYCNWYNKTNYNYSGGIFKTSYKIIDRQFMDVIYRDTDSTLFPAQSKYVKTFYCNIKQGLLGFKYSDGEIFELVN